ncbi:LysM peptidoglycan-binding domain-containing protein [Neotamlana laminarinivorans]|uniref:LysM peptidoglycan-binding domain-containing protein n=1 Tax=Neotamlana laminarinivorans TaxID=2883124 RepID=A0A9X1I3Z2_9FLAO|nr:LysM peptidoglycan-binding domain-containing protein [Tamlana laminarinivorans]MCB4799987.1 LysM peptidoglycan-binding domain-containing protein [Tamlana laminarinivorans]
MKKFLIVFVLISWFNTVNAQNFSTHQVKEGETVELIAERYFVTPSEIYSLNPDAKKELKPNTILIIPLSKAKKPKVTVIKELEGFKTHKTKRKETLYGLSKMYNITEDELKKNNTFLYANPLKKGDEIKIPIYKITEVVEEIPQTVEYTVLPQEGKWRIAYKYGISVKELEELNPDMGAVLKEGQIINVPNLEKTEQKVVDEKYSYYKVLQAEGFYRLKVKLGLEKDQIEALNPGLAESGLKEGMILKIPYSNTLEAINSSGMKAINLADSISDFSTKHIAIMLPFRLDRVDFDSIVDTKKSIKTDRYLNASLDFYSGVLMALDSLKKLGVSVKVDVYDTKGQVSEVTNILANNDFEGIDAVIGPLTTKTFDKVASELNRFSVPVVSPIGSNLKLHGNVFQSKPSDDLLKTKIINYVKKDSLATNIVVISDTKTADIALELKNEFNAARLVTSKKDKKTGKDEFYVMQGDVQRVLTPGKNIVFLETSNEGFASNVSSILASLNNKVLISGSKPTEIILTTTNVNEAFEGDQINNTHLSNLKFLFATSSKESSFNDTSSFTKKYDKLYNITPNKRAVKGFDLTMDVILRLVTSENLFISAKETLLTEYVENKFSYKHMLYGGYYNDSVYLVRYDNLSVVEVEQ